MTKVQDGVVPEEKAHSDHHHEGLGQQTKPADKTQHKKPKQEKLFLYKIRAL
jgi:hypothetical protein